MIKGTVKIADREYEFENKAEEAMLNKWKDWYEITRETLEEEKTRKEEAAKRIENYDCYFYVEAERGGFGNNYPSFCSHPDNKDIPLGEDLPCEECPYYISHPDIFNLIVEATRTKPFSQRIQSIEIRMRGE